MINSHLLLEKLVDLAGGPREDGYILALDGVGLENIRQELTTSKATYSVVRPVTELALRRMISKAEGRPFIALIGEKLANRLPMDLLRSSVGARIHALEFQDVLSVLLGIPIVGSNDQEINSLALSCIDKLRNSLRMRTLPTVIDRKLLSELLLDVCVGKQIRTTTPSELIANWLGEEWDPHVLKLVRKTLPSLHGTEGRIVSWALNPPELLQSILLNGILLAVDEPEIPQSAWGKLWESTSDKEVGLDASVLRKKFSQMAKEILDVLAEESGIYLAEAEKLAQKLLAPKILETSTMLPIGLRNRCNTIAKEALERAVDSAEIEWLKNHRAAKSYKNQIRVVECISRLSRYLAQPEFLPTADRTLTDQINNYISNSSFADVVASQLERAMASDHRYGTEGRLILEKYHTRRNQENHNFALTLTRGYEKAIHTEAIPLHRLWKNKIFPNLKKPEKLYLIVLDGCSYPVFIEFLKQLNHLGIGLDLKRGGVLPSKIMSLNNPPDTDPDNSKTQPVLSLLPTITGHARGALFLGEIPKDPLTSETLWKESGEKTTDPARFKANLMLKNRTRQLFLKKDLTDSGKKLCEALQSPTHIIATVFNAIDDQIGSHNTGYHSTIKPEEISGFLSSLKAAFDNKRQVFLTSDHGHTRFIGNHCRSGAGPTSRYLEIDNTLPEGFMEIDVAGTGGSEKPLAFAWKMGTYRGTPQVGFHGGCSLEEMVVPAVWLKRKGGTLAEPRWWFTK